MGALGQDVRYGVRMLASRPGFTAVALLTLAIGIGANTAIFSLVNAVLLRSLPYRDPDRLVMLWHHYDGMNLPKASLSVPSYVEYRDHVPAFEHVAVGTNWSANLTGAGDPERVQGARVTASFLATLGVAPALGRDFLPEEDRPGGERVVLLSHGLWKRRFGTDPGIIGKTLELNGETHTVVGVLPDGFAFLQPIDLWKPIAFTPEQASPTNHGFEYLIGVARLKTGASMARARAEMDGVEARLRKEFYVEGWGVTMTPLREEIVGDVRPALALLQAAVVCVLLIACSNVANLLLARATARRREIGIRTALGASRMRLVRQLLTESVLLSLAGGLGGLLVAVWAEQLLVLAVPEGPARLVLGDRGAGLDPTVLGFTLGLSVLTGIIFGLVPALQASRVDLNESLKEGGRSQGLGGRGHRLLGAFVVSQVAVAFVLLVGAGLLMRSFQRLSAIDPGFRAANLLTVSVSLPESRYVDPAQVGSFYDDLLRRLSGLPGARAAAAVTNLPMSGDNASSSFVIEGAPVPDGQPGPHGDSHYASAGYFAAMGIPLVRGRFIDERDARDGHPVIVIDQVLADRYWPEQDPIGHRLARSAEGTPGSPLWREIVGVVGHVKKYGLDGRVKEQYYIPAAQAPQRRMYVVVRADGDPGRLAGAVRGAVRSIDPSLPVYQVRTMQEVVDGTMVARRVSMQLLSVFAAVALALAGIGLYGVLSYAVSQRTREIGIRMALGARPRAIVRMMVRRGMILTAAGLGLGIAAALAAGRGMASLLFATPPTDPLTFVAITAILSLVACTAAFVPARRAARIDPMVALREE